MNDIDVSLLRKRYRSIELIGRGGMASVYRGRDVALARDVAIKMYPPAKSPADAKRQEDEVNVVARLSHHSLVTLFDAGIERGTPDAPRVYLVMELVTGSDLQKTIGTSELSARQIAYIGHDIAEALQYIHHHGVVHRDIKPSNILMVDYRDRSERARAKLTDFGIAAQSGCESATDGEHTTGTAAYLSPEQVRRGSVDTASDIYSFGLVLLECFTRKLAFPGEPVASALARLETGPTIPAAIPAEWRRILAAMTATNPRDRPIARDLVTSMRDLVIAETARHRTDLVRAAARREVLLSAPPDEALDRLSRISARALGVPLSIISIGDGDRLWFTCADSLQRAIDPRLLTEPRNAAEFGLPFYAGVPLRTHDGLTVGTLCIVDSAPRTLTNDELSTLDDLAALVMNELERHPNALRVVETVSA